MLSIQARLKFNLLGNCKPVSFDDRPNRCKWVLPFRRFDRANYTASHELLHLLMILSGFPGSFSLTTGQPQLDNN